MRMVNSYSGSGTRTLHEDALAPRKILGGPILVGSSSMAARCGWPYNYY